MKRKFGLLAAVLLVGLLVRPAAAEAAPVGAAPDLARREHPSLAWVSDPRPGELRAQQDAPAPAVWGWCGVITPEKKLIRMFKKRGGTKVPLYCGGPKYSMHPSWGLRHIMQRHEDDWEAKAAGTHQNWRQLADISIDAVLKDPVVAGPEVNGKRCFSRYVYLWDYEKDQVVDFMTVRVIFRAHGSHKIITAYPAAANCDYGLG